MREYGSEHPGIILADHYFERLADLERNEVYLRSGREALMYVSENIGHDEKSVIFIPAYCCWSMIAPFQKTGWQIVYYRLNEDLTIDISYLQELLMQYRPTAMLTMNYYGATDTAPSVRLAKSVLPELIVIEDFSHCTFSLKGIFNDSIDYYVSSIRKSIGVCDGAIVLSKSKIDGRIMSDSKPITDFSEHRFLAQQAKSRYVYTQSQDSKQKYLQEIRACEDLIAEFDCPRPMSSIAHEMLSYINGKEIAFARRTNMAHLYSLLQGKVQMISGIERCMGGAPFSLPILVENRDEVQRKFAQQGVYAPVLWPICEEARRICSNSAYISDHMLSIPID